MTTPENQPQPEHISNPLSPEKKQAIIDRFAELQERAAILDITLNGAVTDSSAKDLFLDMGARELEFGASMVKPKVAVAALDLLHDPNQEISLEGIHHGFGGGKYDTKEPYTQPVMVRNAVRDMLALGSGNRAEVGLVRRMGGVDAVNEHLRARGYEATSLTVAPSGGVYNADINPFEIVRALDELYASSQPNELTRVARESLEEGGEVMKSGDYFGDDDPTPAVRHKGGRLVVPTDDGKLSTVTYAFMSSTRRYDGRRALSKWRSLVAEQMVGQMVEELRDPVGTEPRRSLGNFARRVAKYLP